MTDVPSKGFVHPMLQYDPEHEAISGPPLTKEELEETLEWNKQEGIRRLNLVLESCITSAAFSYYFNKPFEEIHQKIQDKQILGFNLGDSRTWVPTWQFNVDEHGLFTSIRPEVEELWGLWGKSDAPWDSVLSFCEYMTYKDEEELGSKSILEYLDEGDARRIDLVRDNITHRHDHN